MTTQTPDAVPVAQADRDAAFSYWLYRGSLKPDDYRAVKWLRELNQGDYDGKEIVQAFARHRLAALDSRAGDAGEGVENGYTADDAVDFVFNRLAAKLGLADWQVVEGSEEWEGDVSATLHRLLVDAGIIDDETGAVATLATPAPAVDAQEGLLAKADAAVTFALDLAGGYSTPEMDAGIDYAQARGFDRWSMQAQIDQTRAFFAPIAPPAVGAVPAGEVGTGDLEVCPSCGALPVDWTENPFDEAAINEAVERMRANPFGDDAHLLGTTQQDDRMRHYARAALSHGEGRK